MAGIFPAPTGVSPIDADNAYTPVNAPIGCDPQYYGRECQTLNYAWAMNAIVSELLAILDRLGYAYNCGRVDNVGTALADIIGQINARLAANTAALVAFGNRLDLAETDIDALQASMATIQGTVAQQGNDIVSIQTYLQNLDATQVKLNPPLGSYTTVQQALGFAYQQATPMPPNTFRANNTAGSASPNISPDEAAEMLPVAVPGTKGLLPSLSGSVTDVLRGDGTWGPSGNVAGGGVYISPTPPADAQAAALWWENDSGLLFIRYQDLDTTQWVQINTSPTGVPEAPLDGQAYERKAGAWALAGSSGGGSTFPEAPTDGKLYGRINTMWQEGLPIVGGTLTGPLYGTIGSFTAPVGAGGGSYALSGTAQGGAGGVIGFAPGGSVYGILGYGSYSLYGQGNGYLSGSMSLGGNVAASSGVFTGAVTAHLGIQTWDRFDVVPSGTGSVSFSFGVPSWNAINVNPSSYYIYFAFAGNNRYGLATDRWTPLTGTPYLGTSSGRWGTLYTTANPNVSSDLKLKTDIHPFSEAEIAVARKIFPLLRTFKLRAEGEEAKIRAGVIAQDLEALFTSEGLSIEQYAFYEKTADVESVVLEDGSMQTTPTGDFTRSVIYTELLVWLMAGLAAQVAGP